LVFLIALNWGLLLGISYYLHDHKLLLDMNGLAMPEFQYDFSLVVSLSIFVFLLLFQINVDSKAISNAITFLGKHSFSAYLLQTNPLVFTFLITGQYIFLQKQSSLMMTGKLLLFSSMWFFGAIILDILRSMIFNFFLLCVKICRTKFKRGQSLK
jgi:uncharacterized membrane protein YeiB